jgi:hypothetical protein
MGANDPRLTSAHTIDFLLQRTLKAWKTTDPAPLHIKLIPISVIRRIAVLSQTTHRDLSIFSATAGMIIIAFFFLLHPGKYTDNNNDPLLLQKVQLFIGPMQLNIDTATIKQIQQARDCSACSLNTTE